MKRWKVKQHEEKDCGAAVFATIVNTYGERISLAKARELVHTSKIGSTLYGLNEAMKKYGFESDVLEGTRHELLKEIHAGAIQLPVIVHVMTAEGLSHFLVIERVKAERVLVFDPASGEKTLSFHEFEELWTGLVMTAIPSDGWTPKFRGCLRFQKYFELIERVKFPLILVSVFSLGISGISIVGSLLYRRVIDGFILKGSEVNPSVNGAFETFFSPIFSNLQLLFLATLALYVFQALLLVIRSYVVANISVKMGESLFLHLFKKLLRLPATFFSYRESGELLARFQLVSEFQQKLAEISLSIVLEVFLAIAGGIVLFRIHAFLFGITCLLVVGYLFITLGFIRPLKRVNSKMIDANASTLTIYTQSLKGIEDIQLMNATEKFVQQFQKRVHKLLLFGKQGVILQNCQKISVFLMEMLGVVFIFWRGSLLVLNHGMTLGNLISFNLLMVYFLTPLKNLVEKQKEIQELLVLADKLDDIFEVEDEQVVIPERGFPKDLPLILELQQVSFSYGRGALILEDVSQKFVNGMHYVIAGKSGVGKTSLLKLLASLSVPEQGKVLLNGVEIHENYAAYRAFVAYVPNDPMLFSGTIRENLWLNGKEEEDEWTVRILYRVGIDALVRELPKGLATKVSENGENFSSGQRQRIALARVLLSRPKILLLDEALSSLDLDSRREIFSLIQEQMAEGILVSTSHEAEWAQLGDEVLEIVERKLVGDKL